MALVQIHLHAASRMQLILGNDQHFLSIYPGTAGKETSHAMQARNCQFEWNEGDCLRVHGGLRGMALSLYLEILEKIRKQNLEEMII